MAKGNFAAFFAYVRTNLFGGSLSGGQVLGINSILDAWNKYGNDNVQELAYALATAKHETDSKMLPITEYGGRSYFDKYEPGTKLGKQLGNTNKGDGARYKGRGQVMITGRRNYRKAGAELGVDLEGNPELALDPLVSARVLVVGTLEGWFTGKDLGDYIDDVDESDAEDQAEYVNARRVVNGTDRATDIARAALVFEAALKLGEPTGGAAPAEPAPEPAQQPNLFAAIIAALIQIFAAFAKRRAA